MACGQQRGSPQAFGKEALAGLEGRREEYREQMVKDFRSPETGNPEVQFQVSGFTHNALFKPKTKDIKDIT